MGIFDMFSKRAEEPTPAETSPGGAMTSDALVTAIIGETKVGVSEAVSIPEVQYCLDLIGGTIAGLPIRLYKKDTKEEIEGDERLYLLNVDTKDTLTATQMWKIMLQDYFFAPYGGYCYINKKANKYKSLHHIEYGKISCMMNQDPVFKDYSVSIQGNKYLPLDFLKILRKTSDGCHNNTLTQEANLMLSVAYYCYKFEDRLLRKGGGKKGFVKSQKKLTEGAMTALKSAFRKLYSDTDESVVVLNDGLDFQESSNTSTEMQLSENKKENAISIGKLFGIDLSSKETFELTFTKAITRIIQDIESSLNRDLLLEKEKGFFYFAFDTRELTRGSIKERYEAYKVALDSNFMQIDEVREQEDLEAYGINWMKLGLDSVLYNPKTGAIYTPNTKEKIRLEETTTKGGVNDESGDQS